MNSWLTRVCFTISGVTIPSAKASLKSTPSPGSKHAAAQFAYETDVSLFVFSSAVFGFCASTHAYQMINGIRIRIHCGFPFLLRERFIPSSFEFLSIRQWNGAGRESKKGFKYSACCWSLIETRRNLGRQSSSGKTRLNIYRWIDLQNGVFLCPRKRSEPFGLKEMKVGSRCILNETPA